MEYTAMTLASNAPPADPHGINIPFADWLLICAVIFLVIKFFPGGRK